MQTPIFPAQLLKHTSLKKEKREPSVLNQGPVCNLYLSNYSYFTLKISCTERKMESYALIFENETTI